MYVIIFKYYGENMDYKQIIAQKLNIEGVTPQELYSFIEVPPNTDMGDFALPCFKLSKIMRRPPIVIAETLASNFVPDENILSCSAVNGYLNFKINRSGFADKLLAEAMKEKLELFKQPVQYDWIDKIPQTSSGKKQRINIK